MVVVLISARYAKIISWLKKIENIKIKEIDIIKQVGPKVFLYVDTDLSYQAIIDQFKSTIKSQGGAMYVYEFYSIYKEKIDYNSYISAKTKDTMPYFNTKHKDLTGEELHNFKLQKGIIDNG